ncbi:MULTISPECIES: AbrB/MazE/SpoVT family DNA-binding domain-containing protein [Halopenitus]|uniref:Looped-hinge helix DNA binding domain-containing protein, AbrB family n=2 Tax=Halopenitus TaxID=1209988 RepID=A0A1H6HRM0_9EURY|nr:MULTISPECIES: AbrB/MazE/SpoVT family DNA-binding domain-containing protein [Halopenitus]SDX93806.1 transcriptional regulator, AbrB family [Halopenitus persicus]SEH36828.1 looped-hinge helix DNA binding domain-containing protein, AbrB family [Halopenitus malekzadehii]
MAVSEDATVTSKGQVTIPKRIRDALDIDAGTEVEFVLEEDGTIRVRPKTPAMDRLRAVKEALSKHDVDLTKLRRASKDEWGSHFDEDEA